MAGHMGVRARARARLPVRRAPPATTFPNPDGGAGVSYLRCAAQITHRTGGRRRKRPCSGLIALVVATAFPGGWMDRKEPSRPPVFLEAINEAPAGRTTSRSSDAPGFLAPGFRVAVGRETWRSSSSPPRRSGWITPVPGPFQQRA
jgi:hypothetical protein